MVWSEIVEIISNPPLTPTKTILVRYVFQATVHTIWKECISRRHGEIPRDVSCLIKFVDKTVRLRLLSVQGLCDKHLEKGLITWFEARQDPP
ncbi:hypothetical protein F2Q70_00023792 [Brassica cretica]|uniref:Uncharacterized protein n=1 Tax=Brassica cretica TaxID=69181 RepID=A0A8S9GRT3_BRACR|nr:hypothetical protein F2Q70_00023792 [Brassica cretica]